MAVQPAPVRAMTTAPGQVSSACRATLIVFVRSGALTNGVSIIISTARGAFRQRPSIVVTSLSFRPYSCALDSLPMSRKTSCPSTCASGAREEAQRGQIISRMKV